MAEAKDTQPQEPQFRYSYTAEDGEVHEVDANEFSVQGKRAYQKIADLTKRKQELAEAMTEVDVLTNFWNQVIQENEIKANGEDKNPMEEAIEIADGIEKTAHKMLEETGVEPVMKKKKDN